jgi:hypothetical protein
MNAECPLASPGDRRGPRDTRHEPGTLAQAEIYHSLRRKGLPGARFSIGRPAARTRKYEARSGLSSNKAGARRASDQVRGTTDRHGWRNDRASGVAIGPATPIGAWDGWRRARRTRFHPTAQRQPLYGWPTRSELIPNQGRVRWLRLSPIRFIPARTSRSCARLSAPLGGESRTGALSGRTVSRALVRRAQFASARDSTTARGLNSPATSFPLSRSCSPQGRCFGRPGLSFDGTHPITAWTARGSARL